MPFNAPNPNQKPATSGLKGLVQAEKLVQIALVLPIAALIGWFGGALLDRWFHQTWISIVGLIFGIVAGMMEAVRMALGAGKARKRAP